MTIGIFTVNQQGLEGAIFQMLSHGVVSAALFLCVGVIYDRLHTREIARYGGLAENMPSYALVFMVFMLASVGLPGTSGFVGEFLVIMGAFQANTWVALLTASGMVLGAAYMLWLYRSVIFGALTKKDLLTVFAPLLAAALIFGIYPLPLLEVMDASVANLIENYELALATSEGTSFARLWPLN